MRPPRRSPWHRRLRVHIRSARTRTGASCHRREGRPCTARATRPAGPRSRGGPVLASGPRCRARSTAVPADRALVACPCQLRRHPGHVRVGEGSARRARLALLGWLVERFVGLVGRLAGLCLRCVRGVGCAAPEASRGSSAAVGGSSRAATPCGADRLRARHGVANGH